ncbi:MAG: segregation/condensation protein A [Actinomycetes bacterium]
MQLADMDLDLDVFTGPFDLLLTLVLREEIDLREVDLAVIVLSYIDRLELRGEIDLEVATEFLVLIAALLELKSRLLLPGEEEAAIDLEPGEAAEELFERLIAQHRNRGASEWLRDRLIAESGYRYRSAPLPAAIRRASLDLAKAVYPASRLGEAIGSLLTPPAQIDIRHLHVPQVSVGERLAALKVLLGRGSFDFDQAVVGADRVTVAVTLWALLELYRRGEATWTQTEPFGPILVGTTEAKARHLEQVA